MLELVLRDSLRQSSAPGINHILNMKERFQNFPWEFVLGSDHVSFPMSFFMYRLAAFPQFQHLSSSSTLGLVGTPPFLSSSKQGRTIINFQLSFPQIRNAHFNGRRAYTTHSYFKVVQGHCSMRKSGISFFWRVVFI